jgi:condensin complex subunit 3
MTTDPKLYKELATLLNQSQDSVAAHAKLIQKCQKLYKENPFDTFFETFTLVMQGIMITMVKNSNVDRIIDFIAKLSSSLSNSNGQDENKPPANNATNAQPSDPSQTNMDIDNNQSQQDEDIEFENPFLTSLIDYLIENNKANSDAVRYRCCHILSKLMCAINNEQFIDEDLYDRLCDSLLERLKDINSRVQVQAIAAIYRLQDPNDRDCRVMKALLFLLTYDPHWQVRYQALSHVAFSKVTLPDIIDRVRDPNPLVRRKALLILSEKVLIKFINIEKRLFILNYSLKDEDKTVLETCTKKLLPSWLAFKENDMCKLLKALDVVDSTDTIELMLNKMNASNSLDTIVNDFLPIINEKHVIPLDKLDAESAYYWCWICNKCKENTPDNEEQQHDEETLTNKQIESDDYLDKLLPSLTEFCDYIEQSIKKFDADKLDKPSENRLHLENSFILKQLIKMLLYVDFSDVHGKKMLTNLCHDLFANKNYSFLFESIMKVYKRLIPNLQTRINNLVELVSDLKDPAQTMTQGQKDEDQSTESNLNTNEMNLNEPQLNSRELALKISELKFQRFKLKDDFDNLYKEIKNVDKQIDMNKLSELRVQIKEVEDEIANLQNKQQNPQPAPAPVVEQQPVTEPSIHFDPIESAYHCLQISICLLQDMDLKQLTPQLRSLCDTLIIPNIGSVNEELRALSVRALNLLCILKLELAQKFMPLLLEIIQCDKKDVVIEAFKACINCIMAFSMDKLINTDSEDTNTRQIATGKILSVMTALLDHEDSDVYTVATEGFCRLYMTGHILSAKLFSKLLIMYYSPLTENDIKLKACLSTFLPNFAFFRSINQLCVEESFMITLKCLINAPADNYLSEIDLIKVVDILFHLTNPKNLMQQRKNQVTTPNNICHENIVKSICYELLKDDNIYKIKTYLKIILMADLSGADYLSLKDLYQLAQDVNEHVQDKLVKKTSQKFVENVFALMTSKQEFREEQERKETEQIKENTTIQNNDNDTVIANEEVKENEEKEHEADKSTDLMIDHGFQKLKIKSNKSNASIASSTMTSKTEQDTSKITTKIDETMEENESQNVTEIEKITTNTRRLSLRRQQNVETGKPDSSKTKIVIEKITPDQKDPDIIDDSLENEEEEEENTVIETSKKRESPRKSITKRSNSAVDPSPTLSVTSKKTNKMLKPSSPPSKKSILTDKTKKEDSKSNSLKPTYSDEARSSRVATRRSQSAISATTASDQDEEPPVKLARKNQQSSSSSLIKKFEPQSEKQQPTRTLRSSSNSQSKSPSKSASTTTRNKNINLMKEFTKTTSTAASNRKSK